MTELQKKILAVFDEYIFGFMRSDIDAAIKGDANYLAALGLVTYTEFLGGLWTGGLGLLGTSKDNFNAFIPYLGEPYQRIHQRVNIYDLVRCGLVHNYFIKGESTIWNKAEGDAPGIIASPGGPTYFICNVYARDLFAGATRFRNEILDEKDPTLAQNFEKGMKNINVW